MVISAGSPDSRRVTFGLVPAQAGEPSRVLLKDLCDQLAEDTHVSVVPHCAPSPSALGSAIEAGRVQLAWVSPTLLLLSPALSRVVPLLSSVRQGVAFYHAVIFVPEGSDAKSAADLAGRRVAWVAPTSAAGYLVPRASLARQRIDPAKLFREELFCESHGDVARAVLDGRADAGATYAVFRGGDPKQPLVRAGFQEIPVAGRFRVVDVAGPIPSDMIVAEPSVPLSLRAALAGALCRLAVDPACSVAIRKIIGAEEFRPFSHAALLELTALVRSAST